MTEPEKRIWREIERRLRDMPNLPLNTHGWADLIKKIIEDDASDKQE